MKTARFDEEQATAAVSSDVEWMMSRHGDSPPIDVSHVDIVSESVNWLGDESQFILRAIFYEGVTYQELGDRLGVSKTHAWRLSKRAVNELKNLLQHNPTLKGRYGMEASWQDACRDSLQTLLWGSGPPAGPLTAAMIDGHRDDLVSQFETNNVYLWGIANLAQGAWARLFEEGFAADLDGCCAMLARKQHDYGHQNILSFMQRGVIVRLCDKLSRLENLDRKDIDPTNESLIDTLLDIIGYCTISRMLDVGTFRLPLNLTIDGFPA